MSQLPSSCENPASDHSLPFSGYAGQKFLEIRSRGPAGNQPDPFRIPQGPERGSTGSEGSMCIRTRKPAGALPAGAGHPAMGSGPGGRQAVRLVFHHGDAASGSCEAHPPRPARGYPSGWCQRYSSSPGRGGTAPSIPGPAPNRRSRKECDSPPLCTPWLQKEVAASVSSEIQRTWGFRARDLLQAVQFLRCGFIETGKDRKQAKTGARLVGGRLRGAGRPTCGEPYRPFPQNRSTRTRLLPGGSGEMTASFRLGSRFCKKKR